MFFKPEELILYRPSTHGGLGMQNVKYKALAGLIRSFLEIASNQNFRHSLYHEILYRYHVLKNHSLVNTGLPPFYSASFFETIKNVHKKAPESLPSMTEGQWYKLLMDKIVLIEENEDCITSLPCRTELSNTENDWEAVRRRSIKNGLGSEQMWLPIQASP